MASAWMDALLMQTVTSDSDEMKLGKQLVEDKSAHSGVDLVDRKASSIEKIEALLVKATERSAPEAVIQGYEKLLKQLAG